MQTRDEDFVAVAASMLALCLDADRRTSVAAAFATYRESAALLMSFPLSAETELASVYTFDDAVERD